MMSISEVEPLGGGRALAPVVNFAPPVNDAEWIMVPNSKEDGFLRDEIKETLKLLKRIHGAKSKSAERRLIEQERRGQRSFTAETLKRKYELFVFGGCKKRCRREFCRCDSAMRFEAGDWRCLVDFARMPRQCFDHNRYATVQFFIGLCERYQRNSRRAWDSFTSIARNIRDFGVALVVFGAGEREEYKAVPGLDVRDTTKWNAKGIFPTGCSYDQLMREAKQFGFDDYAKDLARVGRFKARNHRLQVYLSRADIPFFARLQHDDHEDNTKIKWPDSLKFLRPRGFFSLEQLSSSVFQHVLKPTLWDMDQQKKIALGGVDFMWHFLGIFFGIGYRNDEIGTTNICEHACANIPDWLEENIYNASNKCIRVIRSGRFGKAAHSGQYAPAAPGRGSGNPMMKAGLESFFSLRDNYFAFIAGQTGKDREHCPEQLPGVEREQLAIMKAQATMAPELAARMKNVLPGWIQYQQLNAALMATIDASRDHDLKDWEKCSFLTRLWRSTSDPTDPASLQWFNEADLCHVEPIRREILMGKFLSDPALTRDVRMSRGEVFRSQRDKTKLTKLPWHCLPAVLGEQHCIPNNRHEDTHAVVQGCISFESQYWGPGTWRFQAITKDGRRLYNGERYKCYGIPFLPEVIITTDAQNRFVSVCPRVPDVNPFDETALERAYARQAQWEAEVRTDMSLRHEREAQHIAEVRRHNEEVIEESRTGMTKAARVQKARKEAADAKGAMDALANLPD